MIPAQLDYVTMLERLNSCGWTNWRLDAILGYSPGYCSQVKCGNVKEMTYPKASRFYNFWYEERLARGLDVNVSIHLYSHGAHHQST